MAADAASMESMSSADPLEVKRLIGVVPQENNLDRELTAYENLYIYSMFHNVENRDCQDR